MSGCTYLENLNIKKILSSIYLLIVNENVFSSTTKLSLAEKPEAGIGMESP
jgi:hypothetical protein